MKEEVGNASSKWDTSQFALDDWDLSETTVEQR